MESTRIYKRLAELASDDNAVRSLLALVDRVFQEALDVTKAVVRYMGEYTLHDEVHLRNVVRLMDRLLPDEVLRDLGPMELAALILAAGLHDIGMAPSEEEARSLLMAAEGEAEGEEEEQLRYAAFRGSYPAMLRRKHDLQAAGRNTEAEEIEAYILAEYLREKHGVRGRDFVFGRLSEQLVYDNFKFTARLADVCFSHTEDPVSLERIPCWELVRPGGEYCNWRFVAVLLRLADILDFDPKRTPRVLFEHLGIRSPISVREWKKHKAITGWNIGPGNVAFAAQCPDPVIEKAIRDFVRMIDQELMGAKGVLAGMHDPRAPRLLDKYQLDLPAGADIRDVGPLEGPDGPLYDFVDLSFYLDHESIKSLIMGVHLYADRSLFLRELLQNAVDACRHRRALHDARRDLGPYDPHVAIRLCERDGRQWLEVEDNGMGMDERIIRTHFAQVGSSYYSSPSFLQERTRLALSFQPVAQFGIGVLSAFMAGDLLEVDTRHTRLGSQPFSIQIAGEGALFWFRTGSRATPGTTIRLRLQRSLSDLARKEPGGAEHPCQILATLVSDLAPHVEFPILAEAGSQSEVVAPTWHVSPLRFRDASRRCMAVQLNLSLDGPNGLDGLAEVYVLQENGRFASEVFLDDKEYSDIEGHDLRDRLEHRPGAIDRAYVDLGEKSGEVETGYAPDIRSEGRWSQQGIAVPYPLVGGGSERKTDLIPVQIRFPLPIRYDLNLSADFVFPLSADRKSVLPDESADAVSERIYRVLASLFLSALGSAKVRENREFFDNVVASSRGDGTLFADVLLKFLHEAGA